MRLAGVFHALHMALLPVAIMPLFWRNDIAMSVTLILGVQAIFSAVIAVCEFPSGYLADRLGYRRTLVMASGLIAVGWVVYSAAHGLAAVIAAEALLGVGFSLISGTDRALLYESLVADGRREEYARWLGRMRFWGLVAEGASALVAGLLFSLWPRLPFVLEVPVWVAALLVALAFKEPPRNTTPVSRHWAHATGVVRHLLVDNVRLRTLALFGIALGLATYTPVWLFALYAEDSGVSPAWLGPLWAATNFCTATAGLSSARVGLRGAVVVATVLIGIGYFGMGASYTLAGVAFYYAFTFARGLATPVLSAAEQDAMGSGDRVALASLRNLGFRLSYVLIGPVVGVAVDLHGLHPVLLVAGAVYLGLLALSGSSLLRLKGPLAWGVGRS